MKSLWKSLPKRMLSNRQATVQVHRDDAVYSVPTFVSNGVAQRAARQAETRALFDCIESG